MADRSSSIDELRGVFVAHADYVGSVADRVEAFEAALAEHDREVRVAERMRASGIVMNGAGRNVGKIAQAILDGIPDRGAEPDDAANGGTRG